MLMGFKQIKKDYKQWQTVVQNQKSTTNKVM